MPSTITALILVAIGTSCATIGQWQADHEAKEKTKRDAVAAARAACYSTPPRATVYAAAYALIAARSKIAKESETRGYIETEWAVEQYNSMKRRRLIIELVGSECVRVVPRVENERQDSTSNWIADGMSDDDAFRVELHGRIQHGPPSTSPAPTP